MSTIVYKDKIGQQWFIGIYSNNFEDREKDIFSWKSHIDYAKWANEKGVKLPVTVLHQPQYPPEVHVAHFLGLAMGKLTPDEFSDNYMKMYKPYAFAQTERIIPLNGFVLVFAKILKDKENVVKLLSDSNWRMSHGYLAIKREEHTIDQYRTFEFTSLPDVMAANPVTLSNFMENTIQMDEIKGLSKEDRDFIQQVMNADPDELENATQAAQAVLEKVLESKSMEEETETETAEDFGYEEIRAKLFNDLNVEQLNKAFGQIVDQLNYLTERVEGIAVETKKTEDDIVSEAFNPLVWDAFNKSQEEDEEDVDLEALKESALGEKPIAGTKNNNGATDNPMVLGWIGPMGFDRQ